MNTHKNDVLIDSLRILDADDRFRHYRSEIWENDLLNDCQTRERTNAIIRPLLESLTVADLEAIIKTMFALTSRTVKKQRITRKNKNNKKIRVVALLMFKTSASIGCWKSPTQSTTSLRMKSRRSTQSTTVNTNSQSV